MCVCVCVSECVCVRDRVREQAKTRERESERWRKGRERERETSERLLFILHQLRHIIKLFKQFSSYHTHFVDDEHLQKPNKKEKKGTRLKTGKKQGKSQLYWGQDTSSKRIVKVKPTVWTDRERR